jgi:hypothetical protein
LKYVPVARIEGTQIPTKMPASLSGVPKNPNQSEMEKSREIAAALKIKMSDFLNMKVSCGINFGRKNQSGKKFPL